MANQYKVIGCLARGGQGLVYPAKDTHLDRYVALKGLINVNDAWALAMVTSERNFLTTLDHSNIVRIFNFVTHPNPHSGEPVDYIVVEYVDGPSLGEIKEMAAKDQDPLDGPLLVEHVIAYGIEILDAFDYLHRHRLLYCDMKPNNVIMSANRIKIIDLGAARRADDRKLPIVQTPDFGVSREEINTRGLTVQSDIHTVGKTLEDLLTRARMCSHLPLGQAAIRLIRRRVFSSGTGAGDSRETRQTVPVRSSNVPATQGRITGGPLATGWEGAP